MKHLLERFNDWRLERRIDSLCAAMQRAWGDHRNEDARTLYQQLVSAHKQRSAAQVARMERKQGVRP